MADPRMTGPQQRKANLSDLMVAQSRASAGERVNFCPFGCEDAHLDDLGYCRHLVGFTTDQKTYEPMVWHKGRRIVRVKRERTVIPERDDQPAEVREGPPQLEALLPGDKLVRITVSYRVYRDVDNQPAKRAKAS